MERPQTVDRYYKRNVFGITGAEVFWGLGLPVVLESTFLQLFLKTLGAPNVAIGLIPSFFSIGVSLFALFGDYTTAHLKYKRGAVVVFHLISAFSLLLFGIVLFFLGNGSFILLVFFTCYAVFCICIGMTVPVWQNYLVKIFSEERTVAALGIMMIGQNATKLVSAFLIVKVIERYSFSTNASAWLFVFVGVLFGVGGLFYFFTREEKEDEHIPPRHREPFLSHTITSVRQIAANRNFLVFLAGDFDYIAVIAVISFYANYATIYCGIEPAIAGGAFVGCIYVGSIFSTLVFGVRGVFSLRNKYQVSKVFSLSALIILIGFESYLGFFAASLLLGASRGIRSIAFMPAVKKLTGAEDSTSYFAVAPLVTLPFAFSLPLVYGKLLDSFPQLNGGEYHLIFAISMVLILVGFWSIRQTDFDR